MSRRFWTRAVPLALVVDAAFFCAGYMAVVRWWG